MEMIATMMNTMYNHLKIGAAFTDLHLGRKNNSVVHNEDCLDFVRFFIEETKANKADHIIFMGDWFETRDSISGRTLDYSHRAMTMLSEAFPDFPIFFIIGNHDLVYKNNRSTFNTRIFEPFENVIIVNEPIEYMISDKKVLFCPYLFPEEYTDALMKINKYDVVYGHFEFRGFVVTGDTKVLDHGPDHTEASKCKKIFTGHFHKRQQKNNVHYIGNTFPMDFSDANDRERGMMIYTYDTDDVNYINWDNSPTYIRCSLSELMEAPDTYLRPKATVSCESDVDITYDEVLELREALVNSYGLRELNIFEPPEAYETSEDIDEEDLDHESVSDIVSALLHKVVSDSIDPEKLIQLYNDVG